MLTRSLKSRCSYTFAQTFQDQLDSASPPTHQRLSRDLSLSIPDPLSWIRLMFPICFPPSYRDGMVISCVGPYPIACSGEARKCGRGEGLVGIKF